MDSIVEQVESFLSALPTPSSHREPETLCADYLELYPDDTAESHAILLNAASLDGEFQSKSVFGSVDAAELSVCVLAELAGIVALQALATNASAAWYIRRKAIQTIARMADEDTPPDVWESIMVLVEDGGTISELREAGLEGLAQHHRTEFLHRIKSLAERPKTGSRWWGADSRFTITLAVLGDRDSYPGLIELVFDPQWFSRSRAAAGLQLVREQYGSVESFAQTPLAEAELERTDSVSALKQLAAHTNPFIRRWALSELKKQDAVSIELLLNGLRDEDWGVREQTRLNCLGLEKLELQQSLRNCLADANESRRTKSWLAAALVGLDVAASSIVETGHGDDLWRVPWEFEIAESIRQSIVSHYVVFETESGTDVRYRLEAALRPFDYSEKEAEEDRRRLQVALNTAGIAVTGEVDAGEYHRQGGGSYWVLCLGDENDSQELYVSTIFPAVMFVAVSCQKTATTSSTSLSFPGQLNENRLSQTSDLQKQCRQISEQTGFSWIDSPLCDQKVPGLNVYFFGSREPLSVRDLLFYWQD